MRYLLVLALVSSVAWAEDDVPSYTATYLGTGYSRSSEPEIEAPEFKPYQAPAPESDSDWKASMDRMERESSSRDNGY